MKIFFCILLMAATGSLYAQAEDSASAVEESEYSYPVEENNEQSEEAPPAHTLISPEDVPKTTEYKTERIAIKKFDREKWREIVGKNVYTEKEAERKLEEKEEEKKDIDPPNLTWAGPVLQILFYVLVIGIIGLLIYLVIRNASSLNYRLKKNTLQGEDISRPIENIEELDVNALLQDALAAGNLKLAVRLYYLALLKKLNEAGIIDWKKDKTNRDYLDELFSRNYHYDEIRHLTRTYEEVWYGDHNITREFFETVSVRFESVRQQITVTPQP